VTPAFLAACGGAFHNCGAMKRDSLDALILTETEGENSARWQLGPVFVAGTLVVAGAAGLFWKLQTPAAAAETASPAAISAPAEQLQEGNEGVPVRDSDEAHGQRTRNAWTAEEDEPSAAPAQKLAPLEEASDEASAPEAATTAEPTPDAETAGPVPADGKFYLQAGAFEVRETAERVAERLKAKGFEAFATNYGGPKAGWWHVVRIGPFDSRVAAETSRLELDVTARNDAYVLPRSNGAHHVQVASLHDAKQAERLAARLRRQGHRARVVTLGPAGPDQWHCVRVGPFDDRVEAEGYRRLMAEHGIEGQVIPFVGK